MGLRCSDQFFGVTVSGHLDEKYLLNAIGKMNEGLTEIMCHPSYVDKDYEEHYGDYYKSVGYVHLPKNEMDAITGDNSRQAINAKEIELVNHEKTN